MTNISENQASFGPRSLLLLAATFVLTSAVGCFNKDKITVVGEIRDPGNDCATSLVKYEFKVHRDPVTTVERQDWCAIMEAGEAVTCFLKANNYGPLLNPYLELPQTLPHTTAEPSHPDWKCWEKELDEWDDANSGGGAGGKANGG